MTVDPVEKLMLLMGVCKRDLQVLTEYNLDVVSTNQSENETMTDFATELKKIAEKFASTSTKAIDLVKTAEEEKGLLLDKENHLREKYGNSPTH